MTGIIEKRGDQMDILGALLLTTSSTFGVLILATMVSNAKKRRCQERGYHRWRCVDCRIPDEKHRESLL